MVFNVNVLTVGFDHPLLDCLISGRSTASLTWYYQFLGRITRIDPDKENGLIVDFAGNVERFGRIEEFYYAQEDGIWKLFGENKRLLSGIPIEDIGKYFQKDEYDLELEKISSSIQFPFGKYINRPLSEAPVSYINMLLADYQFSEKDMYIKEEILRIKSLKKKPNII
mgnify:FL=1